MRHRLGIRSAVPAAVLLVLLAGLAGCGNPGGVDGDLVGGWAAVPAPTGFQPNPGTCHLGNYSPSGSRSTYDEVDCALNHRTETVFVGTYASPAADADSPPADGSAAARDAYRTCDIKTTEYVGGQWRNARLWIGVTDPSPAAWTGGSRWFRCDVLEITSIEDDGGLVQRVGSLKNALRQPESPLTLGCYAIRLDKNGLIDTMPATACAGRHNAEYVGLWYAGSTATYPKTDQQWTAFHTGCRESVASYVGVPDDTDLPYRTGVVSLPGGADVWAQGDHAVRCYLWLNGSTITGSLKDKGASKLPVQYSR